MLDFSQTGKNIRKNRIASGFTQESLAEQLEITPDYLSKIENNAKHPSLSMLEKLARILEVDVYTLVGDSDNSGEEYIDEELYPLIKNWEVDTKRLLLKTADNFSEIDKEVKRSKE